jgi:hypothetical protein
MKNKNKIVAKLFYRIIFTGIISLALVVSPIYSLKADAWMTIAGVLLKTGLEKIAVQLNGMIVGALKQASITMLNTQISAVIGGSGGGQVRFIVNWEDYLNDQPTANTKIYMNDYISNMTRGRGSSSSYTSGSSSGNYIAAMQENSEKSIDQTTPRPTYEGDPSQMFASGNFKNMSLYLSGVNNPWAFNIAVDNEYNRQLEKEKRVAEIKSIANQGWIGTGEKNGQGSITLPGISAKEAYTSIQDLPNKALAAAQSIPEVITSVVSKMISKSLQQGFSNIQRSVQKNLSTQNRINSQINSSVNTSGPGARFNANLGL